MHTKRFLPALFLSLLLAGAGCWPSKVPVEKPAAQPPDPLQAGAVQPAADLRITAIKASTNPTGDVTDEGCEGPRIDAVLTVKNFGIDFPTEEGLRAWKALIDEQMEQKVNAYDSFEETPVLSVVARTDFKIGAQEDIVSLLLRELPEGRLRTGQQMDVPVRILVPPAGAIHGFTISGSVQEESREFLATGGKGMLEPHEEQFTLILPDLMPGEVRVLPEDGMATAIVGITNRGEVRTTDRVEVQVNVPDKQGGTSMSWTTRVGEPFLGSIAVGPTEVMPIVGEPDYDHVEVKVIMLCPSAPFGQIRDADPSNDVAVRKATTK